MKVEELKQAKDISLEITRAIRELLEECYKGNDMDLDDFRQEVEETVHFYLY